MNNDKKSIHLQNFIQIPTKFQNKDLNKKWIELKKIRDFCNISIEEKRASKEIGSSLEANLIIELNNELFKLAENIDMSELCITSSAKVKENETTEIVVETIKAKGKKCPVCWKISKINCKKHGHLKI